MTDRTRQNTSIASAVLLACAFLIAALTIIQAGRLQTSRAYAGDAVTGMDGYTLLTASSGFGKDTRPYEFCYVIDNHDEMLFIFEIPQANDKRVVLKSGTSLPGLFAKARGALKP
ncbi:MAG TPA: hypothetical protein DCX60_04620 [Phycisphaerales bacterium]|nr:hypothetical protein [Phycisphaerales bacterium]|tara:strand:- start:228 stop:572 length:345 start_codon:yes stop_codon:yes gene_type:complete